jgi:hypothetical protein
MTCDDHTTTPTPRHFRQNHHAAQTGQITGFSGAGELYRDALHMNNVGRFLAGTTVFATLFGSDRLLPLLHNGYTESYIPAMDRTLTDEQKNQILALVSTTIDSASN